MGVVLERGRDKMVGVMSKFLLIKFTLFSLGTPTGCIV